jgi:hypothetical protein
MTLLPLMQFIFDSTWPAAGPQVFMTATRVWGPLGSSILLAFLFATPWLMIIGLIFTMIFLWANPRYYESVKWEEVIDND